MVRIHWWTTEWHSHLSLCFRILTLSSQRLLLRLTKLCMELREFCFGNGICSLCVCQLSMNAPCTGDHTGGVMVSVLTSSSVNQPRLVQTKDYKIGICCFSTKHAALRSNSKDGLPRNQDNVSK